MHSHIYIQTLKWKFSQNLTNAKHLKPNLSRPGRRGIAILTCSAATPVRSPAVNAVCRKELTTALKSLGSNVTHTFTMGLPLLAASPALSHTLKLPLTAQRGTRQAAEQVSMVIFFSLQGWID